MHGDEQKIWLSKNGNNIVFDIVIPTQKGLIFCMYFNHDTEIAGAATSSGRRLMLNQAHDILGHGDENRTRSTAKGLGIELKPGTMNP